MIYLNKDRNPSKLFKKRSLPLKKWIVITKTLAVSDMLSSNAAKCGSSKKMLKLGKTINLN